jgi:putative membrane protein
LIFGGIALWRATSRAGREERPASYRSAEQVLAERFARGEIDEDEYARRRESLKSRG